MGSSPSRSPPNSRPGEGGGLDLDLDSNTGMHRCFSHAPEWGDGGGEEVREMKYLFINPTLTVNLTVNLIAGWR